jgi:hypothetical protein
VIDQQTDRDRRAHSGDARLLEVRPDRLRAPAEPPAANLRQSIAYGVQQNPDEHAKLLKQQQLTGMTPEAAAPFVQQTQQAIDVESLNPEQMVSSHPRTAAWATNPDNAAVSGAEDLHRLTRIEQHAATMRAYTPSWQDKISDAAQNAYEFLGGSGSLKQRVFDYPLVRMGVGALRGTEELAGNAASFAGLHGNNATGLNVLQRSARSLEPFNFGEDETGLDKLAANIGPMVPAVIASGGTSLLARTLGLSDKAAKVLAGLSVGGMFTADQGGKTFNAMKDQGASDYDARLAANRVAAITAPANALFGATDLVPLLRDNPFLTSIGLGGVTGASGQFAQNVVTGRPKTEGLASAAIEGAAVQGGMHLGMGFMESMGEAVNEVEASKLRLRSQEKFEEAVGNIFQGDESLRIPAQEFVNYFVDKDIDPAEMANRVGVKNLTEAAAAGSDLEIPKENYFAKLDPEHQRGLLQDVVDPSTNMTTRQATEGRQELEDWISGGGVEKLQGDFAAADAETQATPEWQKVYGDLKQRYVDAGESETAADSYAQLQANAISNLAKRAGLKADELLALHNPKVVAGEAGAGTLFQSPVPEGSIEGQTGRETTLHTPTSRMPAAYRLVEADSLVPSHNAQSFERNPQYPEGVQERAYDTSKEAQARVIQQSQSYEPAYTVNSNPDAVNGPPVITPEGVVLGGNSRAMSTQRHYADGGDAYRNYLRQNAESFGFTPEQVDAMEKPVLVRQIAAPEGTPALRRLGTELNKSMTGALGVAERAVSAGKNITPDTLRWAADTLNSEDLTLRELMARHGQELVSRMVRDGVITDRERPQFVDAASGGLSEEGKSFVERALLGTVIDDPRLMDAAPKSVLQKLERSLGAITSFASREDEWNILPAIRSAVGELGSIQREGSSVELRLGQTDLFGGERNPVVDALVKALDGKPTEVKAAFDDFARDADENLPGQARMFGGGDAFDAFNHAFGSKLSEKEFHDGLDELAATGTAGTDSEPASNAAGDEGLPEQPAGDAAPGSESSAGSVPEPAEAVHPAGSAEAASPRSDAGVESPRGWFRVLPDGRYEIGKTKLGDFSTFIHEPAHAYLELFRELTQRDGASDELKKDFAKIAEWLGTTPEDAYKNGFTREQHEQWARANEQYVREGKAPTSGLQRAFQNFSVWLQSIYRRASALGVEMTSDIRGVMDRLYAGDSAVDRAETEAGHQQLFETPEEAGWTEQEFRNYARGRGVEEAEARKLILSEMKDAAQRERTETWREEKSTVRDAVTAQVDARPEYRAIRALRSGKLEDGADISLNRDLLVKQFGEERVKALQQLHRGLYRNEGGTDAETTAELLGFGSGEEMVRSLEAAPRRAQAIEQAVRATMTARHGDIRYDGSLDDKARLAVENQERAKNIHTELAALRRRVATLEQRAADSKAAMRAITIEPLEHYQEAARQMIDDKAIADLQPSRYLNASRKFSREAFDALRKGNVKAAADAKNKELLNHFLFREASAARDYADKFESYVKRVQSRGIQQRLGLADQNAIQAGRVGDYRDQFNWLMARYRLGPAPQAPERSLRDWADDVYGVGNEVAIDPQIFNEQRFVDYRNAPLSEVKALHEALVNVRHLALREFQMYVQGKQVKFAEARQAMIEAARANLKTTPERIFEENISRGDKFLRGLQWVDSRLIRMERLVEWMDGGKSGPWHENLWNLASDAQGDEYKLQENVTKVVSDALADMPAEMRKRLWTEKVNVDGIPEPLPRRRLLSMAFNMGNEGNLDRLRKTFTAYGWDPEAIKTIGGLLTREEWMFVQKAWDSLKPMGERMQELQKRLTGLPPAMVKVTPFKVVRPEGNEEIELDGGYFPIVMDPRFSQRAIEQDSKESAQNAMQSGYVRATTAKGYTKERTGFGGPLLLDYEQVLTSHVAKVSKDLSHREFMLASQRFLLDTEVRKTLRETLGPAYEQQFMPWLRTIINDNNGSVQERLDGLKDGMQKLRGNIVSASLGFNASTSLLQISHAPRMMLYAKTSSLAQSFVDLLAHPIETSREVRDLSPNEMKFRGDNLDRDIRAVLQEPTYHGRLYAQGSGGGALRSRADGSPAFAYALEGGLSRRAR